MAENRVTGVAEEVLSDGGTTTVRVSGLAEEVLSNGGTTLTIVSGLALEVLSSVTTVSGGFGSGQPTIIIIQ